MGCKKKKRKEFIFNRFYIITTLPYANDVPHVGHAIEFFQADANARYFRKTLGQENVFFNVGVDEHGLKVFTAAQEHGTTLEKYLEELVPKWLDFCSMLHISFDNFYRTSSLDHHEGSKRIWEICNEKGDVYKKHYDGLYCVGCESFLLERDLVDLGVFLARSPSAGFSPMVYWKEINLTFSNAKILLIQRDPDTWYEIP